MTEFTGPDLCKLTACEVVDLLKARKVSTGELIDAAMTRIAQVEPAINAMPTLCEDRARAAAEEVSGDDSHAGWLAGLPIGIKDLTSVAGVRTTFGTLGLSNNVPKQSDSMVLRLEARGGVVIGKTNTPEFGAGGNTFNPVLGTTRNVWDTRMNAGGSSGGAAASLASGEVWLSQGSDHGGSLRTPAAYNGVVGFRPSPGIVSSVDGPAGFGMEAVDGPMARNVEDAALFLDAMAGFDPIDPISFPPPATPYREAVRRAPERLKIAFSPDLGGFSPVEDVVAENLVGTLARMERAGSSVEEVAPKIDGLEQTYHVLRGLMWAAMARTMPPSITDHFKDTLAENTRFGQGLTADDVTQAMVARGRIAHDMRLLMADYDVLALPVVGSMPKLVEEEWVHEVNGVTFTGYMDWVRFVFLSTTSALPAVSLPTGLSHDGMPLAIQLIGKPRGEAALLAAARRFEAELDWSGLPIDPVVRH